MNKFLLVAAAATTMLATPAFAITNASECASEGGTMVNVKSSDFCLVQIRPEEYNDPIYDGNQLGVTDCPGDKLNDGDYCMYPVTIRPQVSAPIAPVTTETATIETVTSEVSSTSMESTITNTTTDMANDAIDDAKDSIMDKAIDTVKDETGL